MGVVIKATNLNAEQRASIQARTEDEAHYETL